MLQLMIFVRQKLFVLFQQFIKNLGFILFWSSCTSVYIQVFRELLVVLITTFHSHDK
jgi:hypothetical protein